MTNHNEKRLLKKTGLFKNINSKQFELLYQSLKTVQYLAGELILKEDETGDALYVIKEGDVRVFTLDFNHEKFVLARLTSGDYFGEQALLTSPPRKRNASVEAITDVKLLKIDHKDVLKILDIKVKKTLQTLGKEQLIKKFSKQLPLLKDVSKTLLKKLSNQIRYINEGTVIFKKGDPSDFVYFILSGKVEINIAKTASSNESIVLVGKDQFFGELGLLNVVVQLSKEEFFGELGVLNKAPRVGTAIACTPLNVLQIPAELFYDLYWSNPQLRELVKTLQRTYNTPQRGLVRSTKGKFLNYDAVKTTYHFVGRTIVCWHLLEVDYFIMEEEKVDKSQMQTITYQTGDNTVREISLVNNKIIAINSKGLWDNVGYAVNLLLDQVTLETWQSKLFKATGDLNTPTKTHYINDEEVICYCMNVTYGTIINTIRNGCTQFESLAAMTGASTVCGGCTHKLNELLGKTEWSMAYIDQAKELTPSIHSYRFKLYGKEKVAYTAGQHILVQVFIDQHWVERCYSLISIPEQPYYEILIKKRSHGCVSTWLFENDPTELLIRLSEPQGKFTPDFTAKEPIVYLADGVGIAPGLAFARTLAANNYSRRLHIDYSAATFKECVFMDEFLAIAMHHPNFTINFRDLSQNDMIQIKEIKNFLVEFPQVHFYICGHPNYEQKISAILIEAGVSSDKIHKEIFLSAAL